LALEEEETSWGAAAAAEEGRGSETVEEADVGSGWAAAGWAAREAAG